jgi:endo-1,4-beta-xylanase
MVKGGKPFGGNRLVVPLISGIGAMVLWVVGCSHVDGAPVLQSSPRQLFQVRSRVKLNPELQAKIRQIRRGNLVIRVVDTQGKPVAGKTVQVQQTAHQFAFGTALSSYMFTPQANPVEREQYLAIAKQLFNTAVHENALKWLENEPQRGKVTYTDADRILDWSEKNYPLRMRGHTLFWEVARWNQDWLKALGKDELRSAVQQRATEVCARYKGRIAEYDVLNEMLHDRFFRDRLGDGIVKDMFLACQTADPSAKLYMNDYGILSTWKLREYVQQIRGLLAEGVPIGGIGIQAHVVMEKATPQAMQTALETMAQFNLPIKITEISVGGDTEQVQAQNLVDLYEVAFANAAVQGIYLWGFWETAHWQPQAALYRKDFSPKLGAIAYQDLVFNQWWTQETGISDAQGKSRFKVFFGQHQITVKAKSKAISQLVTVSSAAAQPKEITIILP